MAELGSTKYHFFWHDHTNNTSINYNSIDMTYIQNTGHNKCDQIGGTLIKIDENKNVTHEIIMATAESVKKLRCDEWLKNSRWYAKR